MTIKGGKNLAFFIEFDVAFTIDIDTSNQRSSFCWKYSKVHPKGYLPF